MTPEEIRDEARDELARDTISVTFEVTCEEFSVPEMYGLEFSATYEGCGDVTPDRSGDHDTPNGPPEVLAWLQEPKSYDIAMYGEPLPKWLQEHLSVEFAGEMDAAFLAAIGGQEALEQRAVEKAQ